LLRETGPPSEGKPFVLVTELFVLDLGWPPEILRDPFKLPLPFKSVRYEITKLPPLPPLLDSFKLELCYFAGLELASDEFFIVTCELSD